MKYDLKTFAKRMISIPDHPEIKKAYSFPDKTIYINKDARPGANVIIFEAPTAALPVSPRPSKPSSRS